MSLGKQHDDTHTMGLVASIMYFSYQKNPVPNINLINDTIETVRKFNTEITYSHVLNLIFAIACKNYPSVAIFIMGNKTYSKETFTTFYNDLTQKHAHAQTPLHIAISNENVELVKCFVEQLEYFNELLVIENRDCFPPLYYIKNTVEGAKMLGHILESQHCTEKILKNNSPLRSNIFQYYVDYAHHALLTKLLESEKCTADVIICDHNAFYFVKDITIFALVLGSGKLPLDYFFDKIDIFGYKNERRKIFVDSPYCNDAIVEKFFAYASQSNQKSDAMCVKYILAHLKYSHLAEKYNNNGTIKHKLEIKKNADDLQYVDNSVLLENQILKCQIQKLELENKMLLLDKNIV